MAKVAGRRTRGVVVALIVALPLVLSACSSTNQSPSVVYTALPPLDTAGIGPTPTLETIAITTSAPDNSWSVTFKKPVLAGVPDPALGKMNDAITEKVNGYIHNFTEGTLPQVASGGTPSTLQGDFSIALLSPSIVSLRFVVVTSLSGSNKLDIEPASINFWVPTGAPLDLSDLFNDPNAAVSQLASKAHTALTANLGTTLTWDGKADSLTFFDAWDMTETGLEFTWATGKIAGDAAGPASVTLDWSDLKTLIRSSGPAGQFEQ